MSVHKIERRLKNGKKEVSYYVKYYVPDPEHYDLKKQTTRRGFRTKAEAEAFDQQKKMELRNGVIATDQQITVGEYLEQYFKELEVQDYSPNTLDGYRRNIKKYINPRIGRVRLSELRTFHIQKAYADIIRNGGEKGRPLSPVTVIYCHRVLHKALKMAVNKQLISSNPVDRAEPPRATKYNAKVYTQEQLSSLFEQVQGTCLEIPIKLAGILGLRRGEIAAIRWSDIELEDRRMHVRHGEVSKYKNIHGKKSGIKEKATKNNYTRDISIPAFLVDLLKKERIRQKSMQVEIGMLYDKNDFLCKYNDGRRISLEQLSRLVKDQIKKLAETRGYPDIRMHDLRHSAATYMLNEGIPMEVVKDILGHSSISVTVDLYGHVLNEQRIRAADIMDKTFGEKEDKLLIGQMVITGLLKIFSQTEMPLDQAVLFYF